MSKEIKEKIDSIYAQIESIYDATTFTLNPKIAELTQEIHELQGKCEHNFVNGVCEYCYRLEGE